MPPPTTGAAGLPDFFADVEALDEFLTRPDPGLVRDLAAVAGDLLVLGVAGKMGPTLARLAKRAAPDKRVVGVARFSDPGLAAKLESWGIETIACDLMDRAAIESLPRLANVVFMVGRKFGATDALEETWATNAYVAAMVAESFRAARIVAFSTGCVYPFWPVAGGGAGEDTPPAPPPGEYAQSCVARERLFEYASRRHATPGRLIRLNYAIDLRYGVLHDVARAIHAGGPIDVTTGHVNVIWQGDANAWALRSLARCTTPTSPLNVTGPETVSVRALARAFSRRFDQPARFTGSEAPQAWLNDAGRAFALFGYPRVPLARMIDWTADWIARGGASLNKPTHFEEREGRF